MRIGIDTLAVNRSDFGGDEWYLYNLLQRPVSEFMSQELD